MKPAPAIKRCLRCRSPLVWSDGGRLFHSPAIAQLDKDRDHRNQNAETEDREVCKKISEK